MNFAWDQLSTFDACLETHFVLGGHVKLDNIKNITIILGSTEYDKKWINQS